MHRYLHYAGQNEETEPGNDESLKLMPRDDAVMEQVVNMAKCRVKKSLNEHTRACFQFFSHRMMHAIATMPA